MWRIILEIILNPNLKTQEYPREVRKKSSKIVGEYKKELFVQTSAHHSPQNLPSLPIINHIINCINISAWIFIYSEFFRSRLVKVMKSFYQNIIPFMHDMRGRIHICFMVIFIRLQSFIIKNINFSRLPFVLFMFFNVYIIVFYSLAVLLNMT